MKVQCDECGELVPLGSFEIEDGAIAVTCPSCDATYRVESEAGASAGDEREHEHEHEHEQVSCPKCEAAVPDDATACAKCGLARGHFEQFAREHADAVPDELEAIWEELSENWESEEEHDRFCEAAVRVGAYAYAARCYRRAIDARKGDSIANRRLKKVARMAEAHLMAVASKRNDADDESEPYKAVVILLIVLVLLLGVGGVYLFVKSSRQTDGSNRFQRAPAHTQDRVLRASAVR